MDRNWNDLEKAFREQIVRILRENDSLSDSLTYKEGVDLIEDIASMAVGQVKRWLVEND